VHILVIGAGGMLGAKLVSRLCATDNLNDQIIHRITRYDAVIAPPPPASGFPINTFVGDLSAAGEAEKLIVSRPDVIFHLAAIVSGEAERDTASI
jgi:D-erythronate 2-dehydrogenase